MSETKTVTVWHDTDNAQDALSSVLGISGAALRSNGSLASFPMFAKSENVVIDKTDKAYNKDAHKTLRTKFNVLCAEYYAKVKPIAAGILAADGFRVRSLQPKYNAKGEYLGANIMVRRETKNAGLTMRAENILLKKQLAEMQTKLAALPA